MTDATYPQVIGYRNRGEEVPPPVFPSECPVCGAECISMASGGGVTDGAAYACGGRYSSKPQIQNHTEYWWGACGRDPKGGAA